MTLILVCNSSGVIGKCDANCYEAKSPGCECVCGGANHGAGLKQAMNNTREMINEWIEAYTEKHDLKKAKWEVPALQLTLPLTV